MSSCLVTLSNAAEQDIMAAAAYYAQEGGVALELRFIDALEIAFEHVARHPASGSERYAGPVRIPELRFWPLRRFPWLVFYLEHQERNDVLRVLHAERDIPAWLSANAI